MLKSKIIKKATALCCAFAVSLTGLPEIHANAQTIEMQCEIQQTGGTVAILEMMQSFATKAVSQESKDNALRASRLTYEFEVSNEDELRWAIYKTVDEDVNITLKSSFKITKSITVEGNRDICIYGSNGSSKRVIGTDKELSYLFTVKKGSRVHFFNTILKGGTSSATDVSYRTTSAVLLADGGYIQLESCNVIYSQGALVNIEENGEVSAGNTIFSNARGTSGGFYDCGGAVRIGNGTFTMGNGTEITDNSYGGVYVAENGTFTMNGGSIYRNEGGAGHPDGWKQQADGSYIVDWGMGGAVMCKGTFHFLSGTIKDNSASYGGNGIVVSPTGKMTVDSGANLVAQNTVDLFLYNSNITFKSAPVVPMEALICYSITYGTKVATCPQSISPNACLSINNYTLIKDPQNPNAIITSRDYTVTLDPNGATGKQIVTIPKEYNSTIQLPTDYQMTGYTLTGWRESSTGNICEPGSTQTIVADTTYIAVYEEKNVKVHFNLNNAKASDVCTGNIVTMKYFSQLGLVSYVPEAKGYIFEGWYADKAMTGSELTIVSPYDLKKDTTIELYAKWKTSFVNGGNSSTTTGSTTSNKNTNTTTTTNKGSVTTITHPTKAPSSAPTTSGWLSIDRTKLTMVIGEKYQLEASSDTNQITMRSDSNCVTVNNSGTVRAKRAGTATITVTSGTNTKKCRVKVKAAPKASDIKVKAKTVKKGKTVSVKPVFANNTDCMYVYYSSANTKVATVSASGKVKGLKKGTAKITIKCSTGAKKVVKIKVV